MAKVVGAQPFMWKNRMEFLVCGFGTDLAIAANTGMSQWMQHIPCLPLSPCLSSKQSNKFFCKNHLMLLINPSENSKSTCWGPSAHQFCIRSIHWTLLRASAHEMPLGVWFLFRNLAGKRLAFMLTQVLEESIPCKSRIVDAGIFLAVSWMHPSAPRSCFHVLAMCLSQYGHPHL